MIDISIILASFLLVVTVGVAFKYYRVLRRTRKEYEEAKEALEDIVLSFNRQLRHEAQRLEATAYRIDEIYTKVDGVSRSVGATQETLHTTELKLASALKNEDDQSLRLEEMNKQVNDLATSQTTFATKISNLDEQVKQFLTISEPNVQAAIPIRRDRALAPLTETELSVLEMLSSEGAKTAPEIKDQVKLSREHTARLMKKLYEGGYLERDTVKIPFKYSVKKEMGEILRRTAGETA